MQIRILAALLCLTTPAMAASTDFYSLPSAGAPSSSDLYVVQQGATAPYAGTTNKASPQQLFNSLSVLGAPSGGPAAGDSVACTRSSVAYLCTLSGLAAAATITPAGGSMASTLPTLFGRVVAVDDYGTAHDGTTDDTAHLAAALTQCSTLGGGTVVLGPHQYLFNSGDLTVPTGCMLSGMARPEFSSVASNLTTAPFTLVAGNAHGIHLLHGAAVANLTLRTTAIQSTAPATFRTGLTLLSSFSGTGVMMGSTTSSGDGGDARLENVVIAGFNTCISSSQNGRISGSHVRGDCTSGISIDNSHDWSNFDDIEWYPATTLYSTLAQEVLTVTGAVNNGSGLVRLTLTAPTTTSGYSVPQTGDVWAVWGVGGVGGALGEFAITVISTSGTTVVVDLQGSSFSGSYTSGGSMGIDLYRRNGNAFLVTNSEATTFSKSNDFGHKTCFNFGTGSLGTQFFASSCDMDNVVQDATDTGIIMTGTGNYENAIVGGYVANKYTAAVIGGDSYSRPNKLTNVDFVFLNPATYAIQLTSGDTILTGNAAYGQNAIEIMDGVTSVTMNGNHMPNTSIAYQSAADEIKTIGSGNQFSTAINSCCATQYTGTTASIGGSALTAGTCATAPVTIAGVTANMALSVAPATDPGAAFYTKAAVTGANTVTVSVCAAVAGTPTASVYNVRAIP